MTVARVTQTEAEIIFAANPKARVSQLVTEVIYSASANARPTQIVAEAITSTRMIGASRGVTIVAS